MNLINRVIFVAQSGVCREQMAKEIMKEYLMDDSVEVLSRGLVVQFPEPINQKAEAVLISNGLTTEGLVAEQLEDEDITDSTVIFTMETIHRDKILEQYENVVPENVFVLSEFVGDELEILDPYGGNLQSYGLCYESLKSTIKRLIKKWDEFVSERELSIVSESEDGEDGERE